MVKQDPSEPTEQENASRAITKLRYMTVSLCLNYVDHVYLDHFYVDHVKYLDYVNVNHVYVDHA